jgi:hypothetical protein
VSPPAVATSPSAPPKDAVPDPKADATKADGAKPESKVLSPAPTQVPAPAPGPGADAKDASKKSADAIKAEGAKAADAKLADAAKSAEAARLADGARAGIIQATLFLNIVPWGEVFVNGKSQGVSPPKKFIKLDPGKYKIEVRNTTFPVHAQNLEVKTRDEVTLKHRFQ